MDGNRVREINPTPDITKAAEKCRDYGKNEPFEPCFHKRARTLKRQVKIKQGGKEEDAFILSLLPISREATTQRPSPPNRFRLERGCTSGLGS